MNEQEKLLIIKELALMVLAGQLGMDNRDWALRECEVFAEDAQELEIELAEEIISIQENNSEWVWNSL
jgi:hypothetical protein